VNATSGTEAQGTIDPNDWAPVHESSAGPVIFDLRRISGMHQLYLETSQRLAFAHLSRNYVQVVGDANDG
jgi:hypothetical protein